jgi:hypothetical protein
MCSIGFARLTMFDGMKQVGLAGPLVAQDGQHFRGRGMLGSELVNQGQQQGPFTRVQLRDMETTARIIITVAGKMISEGIPQMSENFHGLPAGDGIQTVDLFHHSAHCPPSWRSVLCSANPGLRKFIHGFSN